MKSNRTFIILSFIFTGVAITGLLLEALCCYSSFELINESNSTNDFGEALGRGLGAAFTYLYLVCIGIMTIGFAIPVIPFSIVMLTRNKKAGYAIAFLVVAIIIIVLAISMFYVNSLYSRSRSSSSSY